MREKGLHPNGLGQCPKHRLIIKEERACALEWKSPLDHFYRAPLLLASLLIDLSFKLAAKSKYQFERLILIWFYVKSFKFEPIP